MYPCVFYDHVRQMAEERGCSVAEALGIARDMGVEAVDVNGAALLADHPEAFRRGIEDRGLRVASVYFFSGTPSGADVDPARAFIEAAARAGARNAMILPAAAPSEGERLAYLKRIVPALDQLGRYARGLGLTLSLENFSRILMPYTLLSDFEYLFANAENVYMTLDTGNFSFHGESAAEALTRFRDRVTHAHLKTWDVPARCQGRTPAFRTAAGEPLYACPLRGDGLVDLDRILTVLRDTRYDGALSVEIYGVSPMEDGLRESVAYLRRFL